MPNAQLVKLTFPVLDHSPESYLAVYSEGYVRKDSELLFVVEDAPSWLSKPITRYIHNKIYAKHAQSKETIIIEAVH